MLKFDHVIEVGNECFERIKMLTTRWKVLPLYPPPWNSPVQNLRKFSDVAGTASRNSSIWMRPADCPFGIVSYLIPNEREIYHLRWYAS